MERPINQRIKKLRKELKLTQQSFAKTIGITQTSLSQIEKEKNGISMEVFQSIITSYQVNVNWLLEGKGPMLAQLSVKDNQQLISPEADIITVTLDHEGENTIAVLDAKAAAGLPQNVNNPQFLADLPTLKMPWPQYQNGEYMMIQVSGDSMHPTVYHQDWLLCRRLYHFNDIAENQIHIVVTPDGVVAKRLSSSVNRDGQLLLTSDNETYPPYQEPTENILQIWRVVLRMSHHLDKERYDIKEELVRMREEISALKNLLDSNA